MTENTAHSTIEAFLIGDDGRQAHDQNVRSLLARNALLVLLETSRVSEGFTKIDLAKRAGLDASSVRRLLTSKTANPTTDNAFRLMAAMGITLEATLPTGKRVSLIKGRRNAAGNGRSAAKKVAVKTATRKKTVVCKQCAANKASSKKAVAKKTVPA